MDDLVDRAERRRRLERARGERPEDAVVVPMGDTWVMCRRDAARAETGGAADVYVVEPDPAIETDTLVDVQEVR